MVSNNSYEKILRKLPKTEKEYQNLQEHVKHSIFVYDGKVKFFKKIYDTNSLTSCYTKDELSKYFIASLGISQDFNYGKQNPTANRIFCVFKDYIDFYNYLINYSHDAMSFYEVILGNNHQKPHFDIDIDKNVFTKMYGEENFDEKVQLILDWIIRSCIEVLKSKKIEIKVNKNILVYTSHSKNKKSFHIIIDKYHHINNHEAKKFYNCVMEYFFKICDSVYKDGNFHKSSFIDSKVYSTLQQFRILGNQKRGSNRPKVFNQKFLFEGNVINHIQSEKPRNKNHENLINLSKSLVSFVKECTPLPEFLTEEEKMAIKGFKNIKIDDDIAKLAFESFKIYWKNNNDSDYLPFRFFKIVGQLITLKRLSPSKCEICNRIHDKENSYLFVLKNNVYWNCRRSENGQSLFIGQIDIKIDTNSELLKIDNIIKDYGIIIIHEDYDEIDDDIEDPKTDLKRIGSNINEINSNVNSEYKSKLVEKSGMNEQKEIIIDDNSSNYIFEIDKMDSAGNNFIVLQNSIDAYLFELYGNLLKKSNKDIYIQKYIKNNLFIVDLGNKLYHQYTISLNKCEHCEKYCIKINVKKNNLIIGENGEIDCDIKRYITKEFDFKYSNICSKKNFEKKKGDKICYKTYHINDVIPTFYENYVKDYNFKNYSIKKKLIDYQIKNNDFTYRITNVKYQNDDMLNNGKKTVRDFLDISMVERLRIDEKFTDDNMIQIIEYIRDIIKNKPEDDKSIIYELLEKQILNDMRNKKAFEYFNTINSSYYKNYIQGEFYISNYLKDPNHVLNIELFSDNKFFILQSPMGSAKTSTVECYAIKLLKEGGSMLIITPRVSFSQSLKSKLYRSTGIEFFHYKDGDDVFGKNFLIIEYESLDKLKKFDYDCIVLDEGYQLMNNVAIELTNKGTDRNKTDDILVNFSAVLKNSKKIIYLDNNVIDIHIDYLKKLTGYNECNIYCNIIDYTKFENGKRGDLICYDSVDKLMDVMLEELKAGKRVCLIQNNVTKLKNIQNDERFKPYNPEIVYRENRDEFFKKFEDINDFFIKNPQIKLFIHTNTISVGIDINCKDIFDSIYLISTSDYGNTCDTLQSAFRIREPKNKVIHFYCDQKNRNHSYDFDDYIKSFINLIYNNYKCYKKYIENNTLDEFKYKKDNFYTVYNHILKSINSDNDLNEIELPEDIINKIYHLKYLPNMYKTYGRNLLINMFKQLGYKVKYVGTVFPCDFKTKDLQFIFKDTELDENINKQIEYKKEESDKIKKTKEENKIEKMNSISESIIKTFKYYYHKAGKESIDVEVIDVFKEIISKNYTDKNFCNRIANVYTEKEEEKKELAKKIENTIVFFKKGFNDVIITEDIVKVFNNSLKTKELNPNELNQICKLYTDSKFIYKQKDLAVNIKISNSRLEGDNDEIRKNNENLLGINLFDGPDFKSNIQVAELCSNFISLYNENLNNNKLMKRYNGMYFNKKYIDKYFNILNCMCEFLVGKPEIENGSSRLKLIKDILQNRELYGENLFEPKINDYKGVMSSDNDAVKKHTNFIRILRILTSNETSKDFIDDLNLLKSEGVDYLKFQINSIEEYIENNDEIDAIDIKNKKGMIKNIETKIENIKKYEYNYALIKKIIRTFNKYILHKCGKELVLDVKNRVYGDIAKDKKNGDKVYRLRDKINKSNLKIQES